MTELYGLLSRYSSTFSLQAGHVIITGRTMMGGLWQVWRWVTTGDQFERMYTRAVCLAVGRV